MEVDDEDWDEYEDPDEPSRTVPDIEDTVDARGNPMNQQPVYDKRINAEVQLQLGDDMTSAKVRKRATGPDGTVIGTYDGNPILNSMVYEVELPDGQVKEYSANVIAVNRWTQVDSDGFTPTMMEGIVDYRKDDATAVSQQECMSRPSKVRDDSERPQQNGDFSPRVGRPVRILDILEGYEGISFSGGGRACQGSRNSGCEPAFVWWLPYTLRKQEETLSAVKSRIQKATHTYGIDIPTSLEHAYAIDKQNGDSFWKNTIDKEMHNVGVVFEILPDGKTVTVGWKRVS
jgi:hypothetical protein